MDQTDSRTDMSRNFNLEILIQTRTNISWFANAKFEPGFESKGLRRCRNGGAPPSGGGVIQGPLSPNPPNSRVPF
jgi:hypothetical protein